MCPGGRRAAVFCEGRAPDHRTGPLEEVTVLGSFTHLAASTSSGSSSTGLLFTLLLMGAVFYFLLIRPQQRRTRQQRELMRDLAVGDDVLTLGGMYGTIRTLEDDEVILEISEGVEVRFLRSAIARKVTYEDEEPPEERHEEEEEEAGGQP